MDQKSTQKASEFNLKTSQTNTEKKSTSPYCYRQTSTIWRRRTRRCRRAFLWTWNRIGFARGAELLRRRTVTGRHRAWSEHTWRRIL